MDDLVDQIRSRIENGAFRVSGHAQGRFDERGLRLTDILASVKTWTIVGTYVQSRMGPSFLAKHDLPGGPIHAVSADAAHAVLVTVYHPDKDKWDEHSTTRRQE
ncbi:hypothetical protein GRZ55_05145 [Chelativorans sp. ZYF759]|uniref:DUF4258 domain-containing protein n=1 Tax=Chelativorans sp. ZYF759 TaxID=2692213 RepID=UPI00145F2F36|nr:DUF4258 domain-containing protein [Chelativorans sp. ZYF759]NMG38629.1 hypothetical protein [Chelativorans sp. ZYF759]